MSVEVLDGSTIVDFVEDDEAFGVFMRERFSHLDTDCDGLLSYAEMLEELRALRVFETHFGIDEKPDPAELSQVYGSLFVQFWSGLQRLSGPRGVQGWDEEDDAWDG